MKNIKLLIMLGSLAALVWLSTHIKNMKKQLIYILPAFLIGGVIGYFLHNPTAKTIYKTDVKTVYQDTCISNKLIADITTTTTSTQEHAVKKGKTISSVDTAPVVSIEKADSIYTTVFEKSYNYGLCKFKFKTTVKANSPATAKHELDYQLDTTMLKEMTTIVNTVVVSKDTVDSATETVKYIPLETSGDKSFYLGAGTSFTTNRFDFGFDISNQKNQFGLYVDPKQINTLDGYRLQYNRKLFKLKAVK